MTMIAVLCHKMNFKKKLQRNENDSTNQLPRLNGKKKKQTPKYLDTFY